DAAHLHAQAGAALHQRQQHPSAAPMAQHVGGDLHGRQGHAPGIELAEAGQPRQFRRLAAHLACLGGLLHYDCARGLADEPYAHLVIATRVPFPGVLSSSNASTSRREPDRPRPMPLPEVQPSVSACSMSAMPGPWSTNSRRTPWRIPSLTVLQLMVPPPP